MAEAAAGALLHNLILFGRLLRYLGLPVHPGRLIDTVEALDHIAIGHKSDFYHTLRSLLVHRREDIPLFDAAFDHFWRRPSTIGFEFPLDALLTQPRPDETLVIPPLGASEAIDGEDDDDAPDVLQVTRTPSAREMLRHKEFAQMTPEEITAVKRLIRRLIWFTAQRRTRRLRPGSGTTPDLRRSIRRNLRYGGEWLNWAYRMPKIKPRPLVVLADISGSMEQYTRLLLHFLYSLAEGLDRRVEVFVFSTRLTPISRALRRRDPDQALAEVGQQVGDWAGGTRIGASLKEFNYRWGRRVLKGGAVVLIISDGWDRGDPQLLAREMGRLQRSSHRLIWLNPLLGSDQYEPLTRGLQAALPFIDDFLPVHNLVSLEALADHLEQLDSPRRARPSVAPGGAAFVGRS